MGIPVVLEHPEVPIQPYVDAGGLDHVERVRLEADTSQVHRGFDVAVRQQHEATLTEAASLPAPVSRAGPQASGPRTTRCCPPTPGRSPRAGSAWRRHSHWSP